ncbi:hypothetical protein SRHO_G00173760 [Serrasalmus rhombeus]
MSSDDLLPPFRRFFVARWLKWRQKDNEMDICGHLHTLFQETSTPCSAIGLQRCGFRSYWLIVYADFSTVQSAGCLWVPTTRVRRNMETEGCGHEAGKGRPSAFRRSGTFHHILSVHVVCANTCIGFEVPKREDA